MSAGTRRRGTARVGCSGWVYEDWRGSVYAPDLPRRSWFAAYAEQFDTVELNSTFYRLPTVRAVERWADQAPAGFVYAVKLGQFGSHRMKLRDASSWLPNHLDRVLRLGPSLGPTLVQLPPRWRRDVGRLDEFLAVATSSSGLRWAVEVRDASWLHDDVFVVLERHGAALCIHDLVADHPWVRTAAWTYVRFHGPGAADHPYVGRYGARRLRRPAERLRAWIDDGVDAYVYFDNDHGGASVADARWFRARLEGRRSTGPAPR